MKEKYQLSNLDKKILYELGRDARQSYKQISQKINSKKEIVAYHINQLQEKGVITKFVPVFSLSQIGIFSSKIYIKLKGLKKEDEEKLYSSLTKNKEIAWVAKSIGSWDLLLGMYSRNVVEFGRIKEKILNKYGRYIGDYEISHIEDGMVFNRNYLINKQTTQRKDFIFGGNVENKNLTKLEINIINLIKNNARFYAVDIANKLEVDARTVVKTIKELKKRNILHGYTVFIDLKKLGLQLHKLCFYLKNYNSNQMEKLLKKLKQNKKIIHLIKSQGSWELEVEMEESQLENIYEYVKELRNLFPDFIKQIALVSITDEMKLDFFPEDFS